MIRKSIFVSLGLCLTLAATAQRAVVLEAYRKYKIDITAADSVAAHAFLHYAFDLHTSIVTEGTEKNYIARHDPSAPEGAQWMLKSVNGGAPSRLDLNTFKKQHSEKIPAPRPDTATFNIVKDDGRELVVSYHYDPASLVPDNEFMKACIITLTFNATTGRLKKSEAEIAETFRIKMFKGDHMSSSVTYQFMDDLKRYVPLREEVSINLKVLGKPLEMITVNEYTNYQRK
ncbi:hypothetical protein ACQKLP_20940 [Chitinophaga sp. NPDC101104]|uniref:hypothetical protein n=1 Tax=Chitinophaga sp. NPDC101104 TaxID=3390561 RepID=UPI003D00EAA5